MVTACPIIILFFLCLVSLLLYAIKITLVEVTLEED